MVADQIVPQVLGMESDRLRYGADSPAQLFQVQMPEIASVVIDRAGGRPLDSEREPEERALAGAGLAGDRDELAGTGANRDVVEDQGTLGLVAERDMVEQDIAAEKFDRFALGLGFRNFAASIGRIRSNAGSVAATAPKDSPSRATADWKAMKTV